MTTIKCISPIDGSTYAERPVLSPDAAKAAVARAKAAQSDWAALPLSDRREKVLAGIALVEARADAADWTRRLREAALKDEAGKALEGALQTIRSFTG